ncbi:MAG TPA: carboxypeptidase-like regulatory domain-containing protein [Cyclobacteriaceae bacterium]|jgi:hypothetical protein|nr:carboxypeptidase-like regulatory domain-containing protein [Cyclobacteriaceae bacterium]
MSKLLLLAFFISSSFTVLFSQKVIRGKVIESNTNNPIPYANIGIRNSSVGTISNADGTFLASVPDDHLKDTVTFSALGYLHQSIPVAQLNSNNSVTIILSTKETFLQEVTISSKREKAKEFDLGNRYSKGGLNMSSAEEATAGASVALLVQNKYPSYYSDLIYPVFLEDAKVRINGNTTGHFKIRVRLFEVDSLTGQPGKDMLNESIVIESDMRSGWLRFDLSKYNLQVNGSFFLAFEWIMDEKDRSELKQVYREFEKQHPDKVLDSMTVDGKKLKIKNYVGFLAGTSFGVSIEPFSLHNYQTFSRMNSLGEWKRAPYILTARVTVSNEPNSLRTKK